MQSIKEAYRKFLNTDYGAQLYNSFKDILYGGEDSLVQILNNNVLQNLPLVQKESLEVCDIGGGDGKRISHILRFLHSKFDLRFRLDFIEQSKQYVDAFDTGPLDSFCETTRFHALFEDVALQSHYDLVFLIQSIFAFENRNAVDKVLSLPHSDGAIIVVSNAPHSFLGSLKLLVDEGYGDNRYEIDHLERGLEKRDVSFSKFEFKTKWTIDKSRYDREIGTLLEWISLGTYSKFSSDKKRLIEVYLSNNTVRKGERTFFSEDEIVLMIPPLRPETIRALRPTF